METRRRLMGVARCAGLKTANRALPMLNARAALVTRCFRASACQSVNVATASWTRTKPARMATPAPATVATRTACESSTNRVTATTPARAGCATGWGATAASPRTSAAMAFERRAKCATTGTGNRVTVATRRVAAKTASPACATSSAQVACAMRVIFRTSVSRPIRAATDALTTARHATMATPRLVMVAAHHVCLKMASRVPVARSVTAGSAIRQSYPTCASP